MGGIFINTIIIENFVTELTVLFVGHSIPSPFSRGSSAFGCGGSHQTLNDLVVGWQISAEQKKKLVKIINAIK